MAASRLWAPWRMEYIRGPKPGGCIFCDLPARGPRHYRENLILCARAGAFVIMNRYPFAPGHVMVVPARHLSELEDLPLEEHRELFDLVRDSVAALRTTIQPDGVNVGINLGAAAGAGIAEHLHVHIVPRWKGDTNFMPVIADVRVIPEALDATYARLAPAFAPLGVHAEQAPAAAESRAAHGARAKGAAKTRGARR